MNGLEGKRGVVLSELDIRGCGNSMKKGSYSLHHLNLMKSLVVEESVPLNEYPSANTEQSGLILKR
jgi:hypothetical protein